MHLGGGWGAGGDFQSVVGSACFGGLGDSDACVWERDGLVPATRYGLPYERAGKAFR